MSNSSGGIPIVGQHQTSNGNYFKLLLPLWLFLAVQFGTGIWWMATISADVRALTRESVRLDTKHEVLDLKFQKLNEQFVRFDERVRIKMEGE